ncbi:MAG: noncanonical pyrimidine nucleotidase, YjjG family [Bdellovibrionales bacterium]|nr:noncanonical pyrimidine nucleotidase, YjjG family [Bdellovibrionales bacterium]
MGYSHIFVDLDDTIFDFQASSEISFEKVMKEIGFHSQWKELFSTFKDISHQLWMDYEKGLVNRKTLRYERFIQTFKLFNIETDPVHASRLYLEQLCVNVCLVDGSKGLLEAIKSKGHSLVFVTNGVASVQFKRLDNTPDIKKLVDHMVVSEECEAPKPHPSMFQKAFDLCDAKEKSEVIMLGDSLSSDIQGAKNFGIDSCWYNPKGLSSGDLNPKHIISSLTEFHKLI